MNGHTGVGEETRDRIFAAAEQLGYHANPAARSLRTGRTGVAGMITRNLANPYFLDLIRGAQTHASGAEIRLAVLDSDYDAQVEQAHIDYLIGQQADALAIAPVGDGASVRRWTRARPQSRTVIINAVAREVPGLMHVTPDNAASVGLAISHLLDLGHRRIAFLTAPAPLMADHDRLETFRELTVPAPVVVETPLDLTNVQAELGRLLADRTPPTAIVTNSDHTAHAVYLACRQAGATVGEDISVVGHDDLPTSELLNPPLTTLRLDRIAVGAAIARRLHHQGPTSDHVQPVELIVRGSTAPPR
jgi:DNA-binding LacI/PurR family transcriptional regulator